MFTLFTGNVCPWFCKKTIYQSANNFSRQAWNTYCMFHLFCSTGRYAMWNVYLPETSVIVAHGLWLESVAELIALLLCFPWFPYFRESCSSELCVRSSVTYLKGWKSEVWRWKLNRHWFNNFPQGNVRIIHYFLHYYRRMIDFDDVVFALAERRMRWMMTRNNKQGLCTKSLEII